MQAYFSLLLIAFALFLSGCSTYSRIKNTEIQTTDNQTSYTAAHVQHRFKDDDLRIFLSFSGGGTRAAALSYGVLEELRDTPITLNGEPKTLLSEVNSISSVSGGSFTAAYYGLYGDAIFTDYEKDFLKQDVQKVLVSGLFNPLNWIKSIFTGFDRTEMAIDYYDRHIFRGATFADLRNDGPLIQINATDLSRGQVFSFRQEYFDFLCSDLSTFNIARAVTASSAVPIAFAPIVIKNHDNCNFDASESILDSDNKVDDIRVKQLQAAFNDYLNKDKVEYVHLVDGGISDNLGVRGLYDIINLQGGIQETMEKLNIKPPKYMVVILVNAAVRPEKPMDKSVSIPSLGDQIDATTSAQIERYTIESIQLLKDSLKKWQTELKTTDGEPVKIYFIQVDFASIKDKQRHRLFNMVSTSLALPAKVVDKITHEGRALLRNSPEFQKLLSDLK